MKKKEEAKELLSKEPKEIRKTVAIIYDGKQYNVRIPKDFAEKAQLDPKLDEFEFTLQISQDKNEIPLLYGVLSDKNDKK